MFYGSYSLFRDIDMILSPNIMTEKKGKRYQGFQTFKLFEYENTRTDLKGCNS